MTTTLFDSGRLRYVFGAFPSGVAAVAAVVESTPVGITASSFTSVSLNPALVSLCIARTSTTWPVLRRAPRLGVSILSAVQGRAGRQLADRHGDRFAELSWRATANGAVLLDGASGWLETSVDQQVRAGDHDIFVLRVHDLDADHDISPLVFHAGQFRRLERRARQPSMSSPTCGVPEVCLACELRRCPGSSQAVIRRSYLDDFDRAAGRAGLPPELTPYALRHCA